MSKAAKPQTTFERWFPWKRYVPVIVAKKECPLEYHQRLVYSYLVYRLRKDQTATRAKIGKTLRLDKKAVKKTLKALADHKLASEEREQYTALVPAEGQAKWFASNGRTDEPWHRRFATYPVLRPKNNSKISTKTNAVLWLLYSLARKHGKPAVLGQAIAGLATLLNMSERGVKQGIDRLAAWGLVERIGTTFLLKEPTPDILKLWETRPILPTTPFSPPKVTLLTEKTDPDYESHRDMVLDINERIDHHSRMMLKADCPEKDIKEYWRYVIHNRLTDEQLWEYAVCDFESAFKIHAEQHRANGYKGHPMKLLWVKVKERFPERNADAY
jgi:Mn-dependent DtxR family transcriptional regulator